MALKPNSSYALPLAIFVKWYNSATKNWRERKLIFGNMMILRIHHKWGKEKNWPKSQWQRQKRKTLRTLCVCVFVFPSPLFFIDSHIGWRSISTNSSELTLKYIHILWMEVFVVAPIFQCYILFSVHMIRYVELAHVDREKPGFLSRIFSMVQKMLISFSVSHALAMICVYQNLQLAVAFYWPNGFIGAVISIGQGNWNHKRTYISSFYCVSWIYH